VVHLPLETTEHYPDIWIMPMSGPKALVVAVPAVLRSA